MAKRSVSWWLIAIMLLAILVGVVGGGVMGAIAGYYVAVQRTPALPQAVGQLTSAQSATQPQTVINQTVTQDAAVIDVVKKSEPAVVTIINTLQSSSRQPSRGNPFGPNPQSPGSNVAEGSGVIIDNQGHVVTNSHVVDGASQIDVVLSDGTKVSAKVIGTDSVADLAVIQISGNVPGFLSLGDSNALQLGEPVVAIGSPLGSYRGSVTTGVVSGLNRAVAGTGQEGLIQTDAAINHGNSGGPLLNLSGEVIGINTLVVRDTNSGDIAEGLGFAIPSNTVAAVTKQLIAQGKVQYPFIGITYNEITPQDAGQMNLPVNQGALVAQVSPNSPAASAGLQANDIITAIDGTKIDDSHPLRSILFQHQPGDTITLTVLRNGSTQSVKLTLGTRPDQPSNSTPG